MRPARLAAALLPLALFGCSRSVLLLEAGADLEPAHVGTERSECTVGAWAAPFLGTNGPNATGVAVDPDCNVIVAGSFQDAVDFGDGPLVSAGGSDAFVAKLSPQGETLWSLRFGDAGEQQATEIATDAEGNVLIAGSSEGTVDFGGGPLTSAGKTVFRAKLDPAGQEVHARLFGDLESFTQIPIHIAALAAGPDGEAVLMGDFEGTIDFGGGPVTSAGLADVFVVKYGRSGGYVFDRRFGDHEPQNAAGDVVVDGDGDVVATGGFVGAMDFGDGPAETQGDQDVFVVKLGPGGETRWSRTFGAERFQAATSVAVDGRGHVAIAGSFEGTFHLGGDFLQSTQGFHFNLFLAELDASGQHRWSRGFGDVSGEEVTGMGYDPLNRLFVAGNFAGTLILDGAGLSTKGGWDIFTASFDGEGNALHARQFGDNQLQRAEGVAVDRLGHVLLTGPFEGELDFGDGPLTGVPGDPDVYVARTQVF